MKITIENRGTGVVKEWDITTESLIKKFGYVFVYGFIGREINRVRPPKRNIGLLINYATAAIITDAIIGKKFGHSDMDDDIEVVESVEHPEEVKEETTDAK